MNSSEKGLEQRYEVKIPIVGIALYQVKRWILCHPSFFKALHPKRQVNNIYFDTYDHYAFQSHVDGYVLVQREMEKRQPCYSSLTEVNPHE